MLKPFFSKLWLIQSVLASDAFIPYETSSTKPLEYKLPGNHEGVVTVYDESNGAIKVEAILEPKKNDKNAKTPNYSYYLTFGEEDKGNFFKNKIYYPTFIEIFFDHRGFFGNSIARGGGGCQLHNLLTLRILRDENDIYKIIETHPQGDSVSYVDLAYIKNNPGNEYKWKYKPSPINSEQVYSLISNFFLKHSNLIPLNTFFNRHGIVLEAKETTFNDQGNLQRVDSTFFWMPPNANDFMVMDRSNGMVDILRNRRLNDDTYSVLFTFNAEPVTLFNPNQVIAHLLDHQLVGEENADKLLSLLKKAYKYNWSKLLSLGTYFESLDNPCQNYSRVSYYASCFYHHIIQLYENNPDSISDTLKSIAGQAYKRVGDFCLAAEAPEYKESPEKRIKDVTYSYLMSAKLGDSEASERLDRFVGHVINLDKDETDKVNLGPIRCNMETVSRLLAAINKLSKR